MRLMKKLLLLVCVLGKKKAVAAAGSANATQAGNVHAAGQQNTLSAFIFVTSFWTLTC